MSCTQATAFATNGIVEAEAFKLVAGEDNLSGYELSPGQTRFLRQRYPLYI